MKVLVLNCGSSSIKYKLFEMTTKEILAQGGIEKIGLPDSFLKLTLPNGEKKIIEREINEHTAGVQFILETLTHKEYGVVNDLHEIKAVGHRVLHGGTKFSGSVLIDDAVIAAVEECCDLGPLHNPANLKGIYAKTDICLKMEQGGMKVEIAPLLGYYEGMNQERSWRVCIHGGEAVKGISCNGTDLQVENAEGTVTSSLFTSDKYQPTVFNITY